MSYPFDKFPAGQSAWEDSREEYNAKCAEVILLHQRYLLQECDYIIPAFKFAKELDIDLDALVRESKGNCNIRLWETMRDMIRERDTTIAGLRAGVLK